MATASGIAAGALKSPITALKFGGRGAKAVGGGVGGAARSVGNAFRSSFPNTIKDPALRAQAIALMTEFTRFQQSALFSANELGKHMQRDLDLRIKHRNTLLIEIKRALTVDDLLKKIDTEFGMEMQRLERGFKNAERTLPQVRKEYAPDLAGKPLKKKREAETYYKGIEDQSQHNLQQLRTIRTEVKKLRTEIEAEAQALGNENTHAEAEHKAFHNGLTAIHKLVKDLSVPAGGDPMVHITDAKLDEFERKVGGLSTLLSQEAERFARIEEVHRRAKQLLQRFDTDFNGIASRLKVITQNRLAMAHNYKALKGLARP